MNQSYKSIYNEQTGTWVAVSELTAAHGKKSKGGKPCLMLYWPCPAQWS